MNVNTLRELIQQDEGLNLEFKEGINLKDKYAKADFLRHILSLANSPGGPAYLLIGVEDKSKKPIGLIEDHGITEERLQQLVNQYCTPPLEFSFSLVALNGIPIGIVEVPPSVSKPHWLTEDIAGRNEKGEEWKLPKGRIFVRRGSITVEADPAGIDQIKDDAERNKKQREFVDVGHVVEHAAASITFSPLPLCRGFVGRAEELKMLKEQIESYPIVLVEGISGIGKTFLLAKCISAQETLKTRAFWLECQEGTSVEQVLEAFSDFAWRKDDKEIREAVQEERSLSDRLHALVGILESRSSLLCLDGFENADDKSVAELAREFIDHCQNARLIICTRERPKSFFTFFTDSGEVPLGGLSEDDAVAMLEHLKIADEKEASLAQVAKKTEGHPLAIKLCTSLVKAFGLSLRDLLNDSPEFGKSLEEHWLSKIYARLSAEERDLLERFSVYDEPVSRDGIGHVSSIQDWTPYLQSLQDKFLISQTSAGHLSMHSLIRDFCRRKLSERGLMQEAARLASGYYLAKHTLAGYNPEMSQDEVSDKLKAHHYLINAADYQLAAKVVHNVQYMLMKWARYMQLLSLIQTSLKTAPTSSATPWFEYYQARILYVQGKKEVSRSIFEKLSKYAGHDVAAESIQMLANIYLNENKSDAVIQLFEANLEVFRGRAKSMQRMFDKIARVYIEKGQVDRAILIYNQILHWQHVEEEKVGAAVTLRQLATIYSAKGDFANAHSILQSARDIAEGINEQRLVGWIDGTRGEVYEKAGEHTKAIECYEQALVIVSEIGNLVEIVPLAEKLITLYKQQSKKKRVSQLSKLVETTKAQISEEQPHSA